MNNRNARKSFERRDSAAVNVDGVAHRLERVEADPDREDDVDIRKCRHAAEPMSPASFATRHAEVRVLEEPEKPEVRPQRNARESVAADAERRRLAHERERGDVIDARARQQDQQIRRGRASRRRPGSTRAARQRRSVRSCGDRS